MLYYISKYCYMIIREAHQSHEFVVLLLHISSHNGCSIITKGAVSKHYMICNMWTERGAYCFSGWSTSNTVRVYQPWFSHVIHYLNQCFSYSYTDSMWSQAIQCNGLWIWTQLLRSWEMWSNCHWSILVSLSFMTCGVGTVRTKPFIYTTFLL